jgi:hypothetical protein
MKTYAFSDTKHFSNELYKRQEWLNTLISKTSDENKIRIWQRELNDIEIEIAEFEWYLQNCTCQVLTPIDELPCKENGVPISKINLIEEWERKDYNITCLGWISLFFPPLIILWALLRWAHQWDKPYI